MQKMPPELTCLPVAIAARRGEDPWPGTFPAGVRIPAVQGVGEGHPAGASRDIGGVLGAHGGEVIAERGDEAERQPRDSILPALAVANEALAAIEVEALHAELGAFKQTEAGAVEEGGHASRNAGHAIQESAHLGRHEHRGALCAGEIGERA
ncbi:hypothetical protein [Sorangium sp. So ce887]|uniref:hypothetical protein n=1 Tax=Sorangium sp. So ce887 TaxID=3133324 RepID=UPI003F60FDE9